MIQIIRRTSNAKINQKWHEYLTTLNKMISENRKGSQRISLDPLQGQSFLFRAVKEQTLTNDCLQIILRHTQRTILIVGFILPAELMTKFYQIVLGKLQIEMTVQSLFGTFVEKAPQSPCDTLYLFLTEDQELSKKRPETEQKLLYNLSMVWVTTESFAKKRCNYWQNREQLFQKQSSLMILKDNANPLEEEVTDKLESLFWNVVVFRPADIDQNHKVPVHELTVKTAYRQPYRQLSQESHEESNFELLFQECCKIALKANYKYSTSIFCLPIVYCLYAWFKEEQRNQKQLIEITLTAYSNNIEEEFVKFSHNIHLPIDELKLRARVTTQKKDLLATFQRHITMLQNLFKTSDIFSMCFANLAKSLSAKEDQIYQRNTHIATKFNSQLLEKLYSQIIVNKFQEGCQSDRTYGDYKSDFKSLLDFYGSESVRVSTQLRTFNEFIMKRKLEYAQNLQKELQGNKRKYIMSQKQELKDRLQIQVGVLQTLEEQILQLQEKRMMIENQNQAMKKSIAQIRNKSTSKDNMTNSPLYSKRKNPQSIESRTLRKELKPLRNSKIQVQRQKNRCCACCSCCQVM